MMITLITFLGLFIWQQNAYSDNYRIPFPQDVMNQIGTYPNSSLPPKIDLLIWNAYKAEIEGWQEDYKKLIKNKELGLIQEYHSHRMNFFEQEQEGGFELAISFYLPFKNPATGVTTFSTASPFKSTYDRTYYREPIVNTPKVSLITHYDLENCDHQLLVINTHAINFVSTYKWQHQMDSISKIISQHEGPLIWGGDFNTWSDKKLTSLKKLVTKMGLSLVEKYENDERHRTFGNPIDHVIYRQMRLTEAKVPKKIATSDHAPMEVSFEHTCN